MADANAGDDINNNNNSNSGSGSKSGSKASAFKLNAHAPEFIPTSHHHLHLPNNNIYLFLDGSASSSPPEWFYGNEQDYHQPPPSPLSFLPHSLSTTPSPNFNLLQLKIIKQVEYLFSDLSLLANDTMSKHVSKDPQGYVPISVIASMKKIKTLLTDQHLLVQALRSSAKLVVSKDGKKVKRSSPFTENYKADLQARTVIVENLPEDHSYHNLEKIFSVVGSVKAIRLCHPPELDPSRSKNEVVISNKIHALVEYENPDVAERAAEGLSDQRDWRKGMRVRVMLRRSPKSVLKGRKSEFDILTDDEDAPPPESPEGTLQITVDIFGDNTAEEDGGGAKKASLRARGKSKSVRIQGHSGRGLLVSPTKMIGSPFHLQCDASNKLINMTPRMPDGSRGFTMGRGKPLTTRSAPTSPLH